MLYSWYAVNTGKLCPIGWYAPTSQDWQTLMDYLESVGLYGIEGKVLKSKSGWSSCDGNGINTTGLNALPWGWFNGSNWSYTGCEGYWWSSSEYNDNSAYFIRIAYDDH